MIEVRQMRRSRREGVALVMVIGFLAVLVLLAVGFAVSMRIERIASQNYAETVRARQMAYAAVARVQSDIESFMGNGLYPSVPGYVPVAGTNRLITGSATNYIPRAILPAATNSLNSGWVNLVVQDPLNNGANMAVGRYAYAAVDCSGFLDVNLDGTTNITATLTDSPGRGLGASTRELYLDAQILRELVPGNEVNVKKGRLTSSLGENTPWVRMESVAEINPVLAYYGSGSPMLPTATPSNLFVYSRAPSGFLRNGTTQQAVFLGTNDVQLTSQRAAILAALQNMPGVGSANANYVMEQIIDYADSDSIPNGSGSPSITVPSMEPMPMINEIAVTSRFYSANGALHMTNQLVIELWYPFVGNNNPQTYTLQIGAQVSGVPGNVVVEPTAPAVIQTVTVAGPWTPNMFRTVTAPLPQYIWTNGTVNWGTLSAAVRVTMRDSGGVQVDGISGGNLNIPFGAAIDTANPPPRGFVQSKAVDDPRMNWDPSPAAQQWRDMTANTHSLGSFNVGYTTAFNPGKDFAGGTAADVALYVANQPFRTAGELGLLLNYNPSSPTGSYWKSIRLLDSSIGANDALPVLDYFTTMPAGEVAHGKVNLNSPHTPVLKTAFHQAKMEGYPGDTTAVVPTLTELDTLASNLFAMGVMTNVSDIARLSDSRVPGATPAKKEGLIRNTANLLTTRQNIFTIIVAGQSGVDSDNNDQITDNEVMAEQRALVLLWRDPFPNARGGHDSFVRFFRWLTD